MANDLVKMVPEFHQQSMTGFAGSGTAYYMKWNSEDNAKAFWKIFAPGAPGTNFNDAPLDSEYTDTTNHKLYIKTGSSAWTVVGAQT